MAERWKDLLVLQHLEGCCEKQEAGLVQQGSADVLRFTATARSTPSFLTAQLEGEDRQSSSSQAVCPEEVGDLSRSRGGNVPDAGLGVGE